jgi:mannose-6-phosphate isomerase-like protein (cupin superfamily)
VSEPNPRDMTDEERIAYHEAAEAEIFTFAYQKPAATTRPKQNTWLVRRPHMSFVIQCVRDGGENNLHYHTNSETAWFVLRGRARFYGPEEKLLGEIGPMEGILMPGGARYKFSKVSEEDLEIAQMVAVHQVGGKKERINVEAHREWMADSPHLQKY